MKNSKKSVVQPVKVFTLLNEEFNKISNDINAKIAENYLVNPLKINRISF
jgi:hypothetical protein